MWHKNKEISKHPKYPKSTLRHYIIYDTYFMEITWTVAQLGYLVTR